MEQEYNVQDVIISNFPERCNKAPQHITFEEFVISRPVPYTFEGCVKVCQDGSLALRLFCVGENDQLPINTVWNVEIPVPCCTSKRYIEDRVVIHQLTSAHDDSPWDTTNSVSLPRDLFVNEDELPVDALTIQWTVQVVATGDGQYEARIKCVILTCSSSGPGHDTSILCGVPGGAAPETGSCMPPDPEKCYKMDSDPRGMCLLVFNYRFDQTSPQAHGLKDVNGLKNDIGVLKEVFEKLHFVVAVHENLKGAEIMEKMSEASRSNHTDYDCFICCITSHGGDGLVYGTDGQKVQIKDIKSVFSATNCPSLQKKPKLFFIQACRGNKPQPAVPVVQSLAFDETERIADEADFLQGNATIENCFAWCDDIQGGWYFQELAKLLDQHGNSYDILTILTMVNKAVSQRCAPNDGKISMQVPEPSFTLREKVVFFKLIPATPAP